VYPLICDTGRTIRWVPKLTVNQPSETLTATYLMPGVGVCRVNLFSQLSNPLTN